MNQIKIYQNGKWSISRSTYNATQRCVVTLYNARPSIPTRREDNPARTSIKTTPSRLYTGKPPQLTAQLNSHACRNLPLRRLIPTPNIQPNLQPRLNRVRRMPRLRIPSPIRTKILPKDRIALNRLERNALLPIIPTLQKPTPLLPRRHTQTREIRPSARTICPQINHERTETVAPTRQ